MSTAATAFRRTLLTHARNSSIRPTTAITTPPLRHRHHLFLHQSTRFFSATAATMGKEGVHNLSAKADFDAALADKDTLMVLDCFATWCGPCKAIAPQVVKFSEKYPDARFYKVDVDEVPDVAQELAVRAMPTFFLFKNGEKVGEIVGANPAALEKAIEANYK